MVAQVCLGKVGAVAARDVSRFARNSRDWQQLIEMCRVVDTVLIDQETIYAPIRSPKSVPDTVSRSREFQVPIQPRARG
jgi:DNA invertase Pin-like site-specific DNA recombinase